MGTNGGEDVASQARGTLREVQGRVSEGMGELRAYADSMDTAVRDFARERPLVAVACALGVGFILGRLASRT